MVNTVKQSNSEKLRDLINEAILDKKGLDVVNLDMRNLYNSITDFFVICHATNPVQMQAIAEEVRKKSRDLMDERTSFVQGRKEDSDWLLLDYFDVVVHIFSEDGRNRYNLESIWGDAEITRFNENGSVSVK